MTRDEAREFAKIAQAYADGKVIEVRFGTGWTEIEDPVFCAPRNDYRIKPEPREWWLVPNAAHACACRDEAVALSKEMDWRVSGIVHVREVVP
jgi:hypothetical protein